MPETILDRGGIGTSPEMGQEGLYGFWKLGGADIPILPFLVDLVDSEGENEKKKKE